MAESDRAGVTSSSPGPTVPNVPAAAFDRAKRQLVLACAAIGGGLAVAGSVDRTTGGVLVLVGWLVGLLALHRLGRTGSDRGGSASSSRS
ncbi:MAG: hypothetical protein K0S65_163 [Labilithrix sp.]|nr:hypothetical protein [Labilithrix sp.]